MKNKIAEILNWLSLTLILIFNVVLIYFFIVEEHYTEIAWYLALIFGVGGFIGLLLHNMKIWKK